VRPKFKPPVATRPAIVSVSLALDSSVAVQLALNKLITSGLPVVISAGNDGVDSCVLLSSLLPNAIVVGASDRTDRAWSGSNSGACLDLYAPGVSVPSLSYRDNGDTGVVTGTSASAALVSGVAAIYLASAPNLSPSDLEYLMTSTATNDVLADVPAGSWNKLLFSLGVVPDSAPRAQFSYKCGARQCEFSAGGSTDDRGIVSYAWDFGDGTQGSGITLKHSFPGTGGSFLVELTVTDTAGQTSSSRAGISFCGPSGCSPE